MALSKEVLEHLIARSTDIVIATDRGGNVSYYNDGASRILGYSGEEILGAYVERVYLDLDEAKRLYGQIMVRVPHHAESLIMLGSIAYQQGDDIQAEAYLEWAIRIHRAVIQQMPKLVRVHASLVNSLLARQHQDEAESWVRNLELPINPMRATMEEFLSRRAQGIQQKLPAMLINTVPKSASESIWNKLAEGLGLAQGHISLGLFPDCLTIPYRVRELGRGGLSAKEHIPATEYNLSTLAAAGVDRVVVQSAKRGRGGLPASCRAHRL